jgi:hypothetical protein
MNRSKLRKIAIVVSSLAALSGSLGIDAAYARGGGGFGGGHMGGFGGGSAFSSGHVGGGMAGLSGMGATHMSFGRSDFGHPNALRSQQAPFCGSGSIAVGCQQL